MASSDEEGEIVPNCVTDYHFLNHDDELVSFTALPLQWRQSEPAIQSENHVFLLGTAADDGLQKVHKRVVAWKFDLSFVQPEVSVLSKDMSWIALQKPRKSFGSTVRTALVTLHWLQFVKKNPETTGRDLWNHLVKAFSSFEVEPSGKDLFDHMPLVTEAVKRDKDLAKCKNPLMLMERPCENTDSNEDVQITKKSKFIVDMDEDDDDRNDGKGSDEDDGLYDHVCAICDNGGEILCCQGRCKRSFHATINDGAGYCESLGFQDAQVKALPTFLCANCKYKQHQCFVCGKLGSSDNSDHAEVFPCISATCGHFYHPKCIARLLEPANKSQAEELQERIAAGESFTCPVHKCFVCKQGENKKVHELQFAICRRCPRAYHRKCLPRSISFEKNYAENIFQRAWENLLPNRILIYCMAHEIIRELETPARDHIQFPDVKGQHKLHGFGFLSRKKRMQVSSNATANLPKRVEKGSHGVNTYDSTPKFWKSTGVPSVRTKPNVAHGIARSSKENIGSASWGFISKSVGKLAMQSNSSISLKTSQGKSTGNIASVIQTKAAQESVIRKANGPSSSAQADMENRMLALIKEATSSFNREEFMKRQKLTATYELFSVNLLENTITTGKVEGSIKAIQAALKKLDEGCSIEDAKTVCEPEILAQVFKWKRKLSIYLAPFLHGMRYTSFGRHFTKVDKLKEVVNRLHCYVENGDTIVDFCCGSNDFSVLMKEKIEKTGKQCSFKNFDLIMPKNDFCFEQRDWMSIKPEELPMGSQLIMGLNPPFGVKASLANKFINKALQFRPKLLILIVPEETNRVDQKRIPYDLIWEDKVILSGKSFYLPGSVDTHNKQLDDWNFKPPPLYLWSRRDWTARHKEIAKERGHILQELSAEGNNARNYLMEENYDGNQDYFSLHESDDLSSMLDEFLDDTDEEAGSNLEGHEGRDQTEKLIQEDSDDCFVSDMCIDMELSSPSHSPTCFRALREAFGTPETEKGCQYQLHKQSHGHISGNSNVNPEIHYHGSSSTIHNTDYSQALAANGSDGYRM